MNFEEQPSSIKGALSSMLYQVYDSNYAQPDFQYEFNIYIWNGVTRPASPQVTIQKKADQFASYRAFIDISRLVTQYIDDAFLNFTSATAPIDVGACWVQIRALAFWDGGSSSTIESNKVLATKGYEYTSEGFNASTTQVLLSDRTTIRLTEDTIQDWLFYDAGRVNQIDISTSTITPLPTGSNSGLEIQGFDIRDAMESAGVWGTDTNMVITYDGVSTLTIPITFDCTNKYGAVSLVYLNKYGVYDSYTFNALSNDSLTKKQETFQKAIFDRADMTHYFDYGVPQDTFYNIQAHQTKTVNTNWIPEDEVGIIQQIFLSKRVYIIEDGKYTACSVANTDFQEQKADNEKLINYTLQLAVSHPLINQIVR